MKPWIAAALMLPSLCPAQELGLLAGQSRLDGQRSAAWMLEYSRDIAPHVFGTIAYVNEGHFVGHHRDGATAQIGLRTPPLAGGLTLQTSVGPYHAFDTTVAESRDGYSDAHTNGVVYGVAARLRSGPSSPWTWNLRVDRIEARHGIDTTLVMAGASYRLKQDASFAHDGAPRGNAARDELVASLGQTIVNSFESERSTARAVDYRHAFTPVLRGSLSWINEGDARLIRRDGVVLQAWLEPTFFDGAWSLGVGFGPYVAVDRYRGGGRDLLGLFSWTASYRIADSWSARLTWHRSVSRWDRDSDILLAGLGYRF